MKNIFVGLCFLFFGYHLFAQPLKNPTLSAPKTNNKSDWALKKALWFQLMPQYNEDSAAIYFKKAELFLKSKSLINNQKLAEIYFAMCKSVIKPYSSNRLDSIASLGNLYLSKIPNSQRDFVFEYRYLYNWSRIKLENGDFKTALQLLNKAILIAANSPRDSLDGEILKDKGCFYNRFNLDSEKKIALSYLKNSYTFYSKKEVSKNFLTIASIYREIISCYMDYPMANTDSVFHYFNKLQKVLKYIKNPNLHAWYYCTYGRQLITTPIPGTNKITEQQYTKGKKNIEKALHILEKYNIGNTDIRPYCYGLLADLYLKENNYNAAIFNYKLSRKFYVKSGSKYGAGDILKYVSKAFEDKGSLDSALKYYKQFYEESVSFEKEKNQRSLRENELQFNVLNQDKELAQKKNQVITYIIILIITAFILIFLLWNYQIKKRNNKKLEVLNIDLENKNSLLDRRNAENELLMREIHHRVKNNLEIVSGLLSLQSAQIDNEETKEAILKGQNRVNSIGIVHQKLYQSSNLGAIEMKDYFLNLSENILDSFDATEKVEVKLAMEEIELDIDTAIPLGLIVNELFTNAIKYAFPNKQNGNITIELEKRPENMLFLNFADNGVGKSDDVKGTGFGSQLISLLTKQLDGEMQTKTQNGTTISFLFKLKG